MPLGEFSYNNSTHLTTKQTPFFLNYGYHPWTGIDTYPEVKNESATQFANRMKEIHEEAAIALRQAADRMKEKFDAHTRPAKEYSPGDKVYLESTNLKTHRPSRKLDDKRFGPFDVIEKIGRSAYKLKLPNSWQALHPVFNESYLTPYRSSQFSQQHKPPPPPSIEIEGEPEYEVEEIRDSRHHRGQLQYLVHWKGYPREEDTWEPTENVKNTQDLIDKFHHSNPQ